MRSLLTCALVAAFAPPQRRLAPPSRVLRMAASESRGKRALRDLYSHVFGTLKVADLEPEVMTVGGDYVVNMVSFRFENPDLAPARLAELVRFRDGKICEIRPYYFDPKPLVDAWAYYSAS